MTNTISEPIIRPQLMTFAEAMEAKLRKNDHKTEWTKMPVEALLKKLEIELEELKVAIQYESAREVMNEAVDVANFAMMVFDRIGRANVDRASPEPPKEGPAVMSEDQFEEHGWWVTNDALISYIWKHKPTGTLYYNNVEEVRRRGLFVYPFDPGLRKP